jgi:hypothetical protein
VANVTTTTTPKIFLFQPFFPVNFNSYFILFYFPFNHIHFYLFFYKKNLVLELLISIFDHHGLAAWG